MHPLTPNLTEMKLEELHAKYNELSKKAIQCQRTGSYSLMNQISMVLEDYSAEIARRQQQMYEEANKKHNFDGIIDIK
jgi:hypothetical protein